MLIRAKAYLQNIALPVAVLLLVGIIIFPIPIYLLDVFLVFSLTISLLLLLSSLSMNQPEKFTVLPTLLLITTLFRLSLNIASTRQILAYGKAPELIAAFGQFVVAGNVAIGIVVFLIITLVQFIVVAKGAERVAEVAARFSLDAMPGRQMSIDADVRGGIISLSEAKQLRKELQNESKLYGALDGAMKFVKGDAIAGLIIALINIFGGFVIGIWQHNLNVTQALEKYTIFTIGDALISQIPALLTAIAAGIAVTRVPTEEDETLNEEISKQLLSKSEVPMLAAIILFLFSLAPGFPFWPLFILSWGLIFFARTPLAEKNNYCKNTLKFEPKSQSALTIYFAEDVFQNIIKEDIFYLELIKLRKEIYETYGLILNDFEYKNLVTLENNKIEFYLFGALLKEINLQNPISISLEIIKTLRSLLIEHKHELMNDTQTRMILDLNHSNSEDLINSLIPKTISVTALTRIFRILLREGVNIKNVPLILQAISESLLLKAGEKINRELFLVSEVRKTLKRNITQSLISQRNELAAWILDAELDNLLANIFLSEVVLHPKIIASLKEVLQGIKISSQQSHLLIVCSAYARSVLASYLLSCRKDLRIIALEELLPEIKLNVLGKIALSNLSEFVDESNQHVVVA